MKINRITKSADSEHPAGTIRREFSLTQAGVIDEITYKSESDFVSSLFKNPMGGDMMDMFNSFFGGKK